MKKTIILTLLSLTLFNCSSKVSEFVSYEVDGAWYWILKYEPDATKADVMEKVRLYANPNQTSYFFAYPNHLDLSNFKSVSFKEFSNIIVNDSPTYGFYKMPNDPKIYDDAVWLLEQSLKP